MEALNRQGANTLLLAVYVALAAACTSPVADPTGPIMEAHPRDSAGVAQGARVAPIFLHGDGKGSIPCAPMIGDMDMFLTESEALQIIVEELNRYGVDLSEREVVADKVTFSWRQYLCVRKKDGTEEWDIIPDAENSTTLAMDLADRKKRIAVEFIWGGDYMESGGISRGRIEVIDERTGERSELGWTGCEYDFLGAARYVRTQIERQARKPWYYGVFYDPVRTARTKEAWESVPEPRIKEMSSESYVEREKTWYENAREQERHRRALLKALEKARSAARDEAYDLLRAQVRDFAEWLKREGAL